MQHTVPVLYDLVASNDLRFSPHCWRSRAVLLYKKIAFETQPVKFTELSNFLPAQLDYHMVPVLKVRENELWYDSWKIACELEERYPDERKIFPSAAHRAGSYFVHTFAMPDFLGCIFRYISPDIFEKALPEDKQYFREKVQRQTGSSIEQLRDARADHQARYTTKAKQLDATFSSSAFMFGEACCYADFMLYSAVQWIRLILNEDAAFCNGQFPALRNWWYRVQELLQQSKMS